MRKPAQHHTSTGEHPAHPKHASATKRPYNTQHLALYGNTITPIHDYHSGLQFKLAPQGSEREKNPQESHSKQHQSRQASLGDENLFERLSLGTANMKRQATKSLVLRME